MRRRTMWRHSMPFSKIGGGIVLAEIVDVNPAADESAPFVERNLTRSGVSGSDFEDPEPCLAGGLDGVSQQGGPDPLSLAVGHHGDVHDLGREGPRMQQQVLPDNPPVVEGSMAAAASGVVGDGLFGLVSQQEQLAGGGVGRSDFHVRRVIGRLRTTPE